MSRIAELTRKALPLMSPADRAEAEQLLTEIEAAPQNPGSPQLPHNLADFKKRAQTAFAKDMQPVCIAIAEALQSGDLTALQGLRVMLPALLADVNRKPVLFDLLAMQLGETFLHGLQEVPK